MSASKLSAAASAFTPSFSAAATATSAPAVVPTSGTTPAGEDWGADEYEDAYGYYDEQGSWVEYDYAEEQQQEEEDDPFNQRTTQQQHQHGEQLALGADDAVTLLHSCYPNHPRTLLQQLLEAFDGDVQQAARILSDMDFEQRRSRIAAAGRATGSSTPSTSTTSSRGGSSGPAGRKQQGFDYSMEQFPALGGGGPAPSSSAAATATAAGGSSQAGAPKGSNWAAVTSKPAAPGAAASSKPRPAGGNPSRQPTAKQSGGREGGSEAAVPWVETGQAVSQEYAAARAEASDHARVRNACFHQATIAFMAGDKALAKELSAKGKAAAEAMWAAHERASSQIYTQRNARLQQQVAAAGKGSAAAPVIDLHGLHVQEMMQSLPQQLAALTKQRHECVSVIVGVGRHTKGPPAARLGPAVEALLRELGYSFKTPQPGLLRVQLR